MEHSKPLKKRERLSPAHKKVLSFIWKIHEGIRNGEEDRVLRSYLKSLWEMELREHLLNEEICISSCIRESDAVTDKFYQFHIALRNKIADALNPDSPGIKENLEQICILLIEMIRHEEIHVKPFMRRNFAIEF